MINYDKILLLLVSFLIFLSINWCHCFTCQDESGKPVDYLVIYKLPKLENFTAGPVREGYGFVYLDSNSSGQRWRLSKQWINESSCSLGRSLQKLFKNINAQNALLYNDQPPKEYNGTKHGATAHAKGILALNRNSGFWLLHSVPRFANLQAGHYSFPESARHNGQVLMCITLRANDTQTIETIGRHLLLMKVNVFTSKLSATFLKKHPVFSDLLNHKWSKNKTMIGEIYSSKRTRFTTFAKDKRHQVDLYSKMIAPILKEDLLVQTWRNGAGEKLDSDCKDNYKAVNIDTIQLSGLNQSNLNWKYTEDHSKWAISMPSKDKMATICIADLNRMKSQLNRGGGSICLHSTPLWTSFNSTVQEVENCPFRHS